VSESITITDQRLIPAREAIAAGRIKVLSVDIFDTLLWRRVPEPADAFLLLGRTLKAGGKLAAHVSPWAFADLRRAAERAAREKVQAVTGYREITLADIYAAMPDHVFAGGFDARVRVATELAHERAQMILDRDLIALMKLAKQNGAKVILVSDTYFTSEQLSDFLVAAGFAERHLIERIYASCEMGKPKYRDLFDVLLKELNVAPDAMLHIGDTADADVNPCRARGIGVVAYGKWFSPRVQTHEFPADRAKRAALLGEGGDFGLTGLRGRLHHRAPVAKDLAPYWSYGAAVLSPVFSAYARWVAGEAKTLGVTRVFGIMREGRFLNRVVEALSPKLTVDELWLSRRAVVRAGLYADDLSLLPEAILLTPGAALDEILDAMGLNRIDLVGVVPPEFDLRQADALPVLSRGIAATPRLVEKVVAASAALRANLLKGLARQVDITKPETIVLLDLGYAATIQTVLARILAREGAKATLTGLYVALNEKAATHVRGGADLRAFLGGEGFDGPTAALLSRTPDVLEHACMCAEGSLASYDAAGNPVLLPNQREPAQLAQMAAMQDGILAGMAEVDALLGDTPAEALQGQAAAIIAAALLYPTPEEAATIGAWRHEANFDLTDVRKLTDLAFSPTDLEYRGWASLQALGRHQVYWPAGALVSANPFIGAAYSAGADGGYAPEHLTTGPLLGGLVIAPDLGVGFDAKRQGAMPLAVNMFGRGEIQAIVKPFGIDAYRRLKFIWPKGRAVVALDYARVHYVGENERRVAKLSPFAWFGVQALGEGGNLTTADTAAEAIVDLDNAPPWPHALEVTLRFKYVKLDPIFGGR
jgi:FMN phosphatase YigB (HAD superfamily)